MNYSNSTTQSSDITERIRLISSSILQLTRVCSEKKKKKRSEVGSRARVNSLSTNVEKEVDRFCALFYKSRPMMSRLVLVLRFADP